MESNVKDFLPLRFLVTHCRAGDGVPVEESFYETVTSDSSKTLQPSSQGGSSFGPTSSTMPSSNKK